MKLITKKAAFLQKSDFNVLDASVIVTKRAIPKTLYEITKKSAFLNMDDSDFVKLTNEEEIEFVRKSNWIKDYLEVVDLDMSELKKLAEDIDREKGKELRWFCVLDPVSKRELCAYIASHSKMLDNTRNSILNLIKEKENENKIDFKKFRR